jgi:F-type H+/Na+-transporting ATPase subunit alpha
MSQYREVAAFAQFGSDLDKATQAQLARGERMMQLLRQPQYAPMPVEDEVVSLLAGTTGGLDDLPVAHVSRFEREFLVWMRQSHPTLLASIREKGTLSPELQEQIQEAIKEFKRGFKP